MKKSKTVIDKADNYSCQDSPIWVPLDPKGYRWGTLEGHSDYIQDIAVTKDGKVITASMDTTLKVFGMEY